MNDSFGYWLAGLIDGEGSFMIGKDKRGVWSNKFTLNLRADDRAILETIHQHLHIGSLYAMAPQGTARPQVRWQVFRHADCMELLNFLARHPLRTKKAHDLRVWREAVLAKDRKERNLIPGLAAKIKEVRSYEE